MASAGEKSLAVGHIPGFQIDPKIFSKDFRAYLKTGNMTYSEGFFV